MNESNPEPRDCRQWVPAQVVRELLATPTDPSVLEDLRQVARWIDSNPLPK